MSLPLSQRLSCGGKPKKEKCLHQTFQQRGHWRVFICSVTHFIILVLDYIKHPCEGAVTIETVTAFQM